MLWLFFIYMSNREQSKEQRVKHNVEIAIARLHSRGSNGILNHIGTVRCEGFITDAVFGGHSVCKGSSMLSIYLDTASVYTTTTGSRIPKSSVDWIDKIEVTPKWISYDEQEREKLKSSKPKTPSAGRPAILK